VTLADYAVAAARLALLATFAATTARVWRRHLAPDWTGALAALAHIVGALAVVVFFSQLLGSFGRFGIWPLIGTLAVALAASLLVTTTRPGRRTRTPDEDAPRTRRRPADAVVLVASSALVLSQWATWVAHNVQAGIGRGGGPANGDTLWYHMPFAASYVQSGWLTRLQFLNGEALVTYYPANTSVLHAIAMAAMGNDSLSVLVNIALVPTALLAGWCIGEDAGVGPGSLAGVAVALTVPVVVISEAGTAKDDVLGLVGLLAAVAFAVHRRSADTAVAGALFGGLAAGLGLGSKLTLVAPVAALFIGLAVLTPQGRRLKTMAVWTAGALATGGFWYLRNAVVVGNPLPGLAVPGLAHPRTPSMEDYGKPLADQLLDADVWRDALLPGARVGLGSAWPVIVVICVGAMAAGAVALRRRRLVPVVVGVMAFAAFVVTPGTVWAPDLMDTGNVRFVTRNLFAFNLRYMLPPVAVALVILPIVARRWRAGHVVATAVLGLVLAATQLGTTGNGSWSGGHAAVALGVAAATVVVFAAARRAPRPAVAVVVLAALVIGGKPYVDVAQRERYDGFALAAWAEEVAPARVGYSGFVFSYPLYGAGLENEVVMIGEEGPVGSWQAASSCEGWRRAVRAEGVSYVVVPVGSTPVAMGIDLARWRVGLAGGIPPDDAPEAGWTSTDPNVDIVFTGDGLVAYRVNGPATAEGCDDAGP